jgi:hypothetical protein
MVPDRPRKLLVTFAHASSRDDVLALVRQLKLSTLPTAKEVFINPDLSLEESKAAYERRQPRNEIRLLMERMLLRLLIRRETYNSGKT